MNKRTVLNAVTEAREFIRCANIVLEDDQLKYIEIGCGNRNSGALRRQSIELTRALSDMRRTRP